MQAALTGLILQVDLINYSPHLRVIFRLIHDEHTHTYGRPSIIIISNNNNGF